MDAVSSDVGAVDDAGSLLDLIGLLYDAAAAPERWRNFLEAGARYFGAFGASFIRYDPARQERSVAFLTGYPDAPREIQVEAMHKLIAVQADDPRVRYSLAHPGQPFHCRQIVTEAELHASRNYVEILQPNGVEYSLMVTLTEPPEAFAGLGFHRGPTGQVFNDENVAALGLLVPHLSRTLAIQDRLGALDQRTQASYQVLDALPTGIIILRVGGNVEYANAAAQALLASRDGIAVAGGGICLARACDEQAFFAALHAVARTGGYRGLWIERPSGRTSFRGLLSLLALVDANELPNQLAEQRIALYLSDPDRALETSEELLQHMFSLTATEARVTERLVAGCSLSEAAAQIGIQPSTARSHLKVVFRKTATASQAALVGAVLSSPVWLGRR